MPRDFLCRRSRGLERGVRWRTARSRRRRFSISCTGFGRTCPNAMRKGALIKSRANIRQIVFPRLDSEYRVETADDNAGRGMTIHNLHCSEVSRWPRGAADTLASLRAAVVPDGEIVLESTPNGAEGVFYEEWHKAEERGYTQHFFPWWYEESTKRMSRKSGGRADGRGREAVAKDGLTEAQIAWRRSRWKLMRGLAAQEYAEDRCLVSWLRGVRI